MPCDTAAVPSAPTTAPALQPSLLSALNAAAEDIWMACQADWPGLSLEVHPELDSTNTRLMAQGRQGQCQPTVLLALSQTAGRGRRGRSWHAHAGDTLTFSVGVPLALEHVPGGGHTLSLAVGLALAEALDGLGALRAPVGLKWPNDLWVGPRKLGGILIEVTPAPGLPEPQRWVVVGVGLNVRGQPPSADAISLWPATDAPDLAVAQVFAQVVPALLQGMARFALSGFAPLQPRFAQRDVLMGRAVQLWGHEAQPGRHAADDEGQCLGVDADGALLVHTAHGLHRWTSGDVSVRPSP